MEVFYSRSDIEQHLSVAFRDRYKRKDAALTGILLARPEDKVAKDLVLRIWSTGTTGWTTPRISSVRVTYRSTS